VLIAGEPRVNDRFLGAVPDAASSVDLAGVSADAIEERRWVTFRHSIAFVLGFSTVFVVLGASVGAVGYVIRDHLPVIEKVAGVILIAMGLNLLGILRIPLLYRTYQIEVPNEPRGAK
jgi:cytochrome c-type biogenesis protein